MLDERSLGIPVIAIGVPTVVDAATLVNDTMDRILGEPQFPPAACPANGG